MSPNSCKTKQLSSLDGGSLLYRKQMGKASRRKVMMQSTKQK